MYLNTHGEVPKLTGTNYLGVMNRRYIEFKLKTPPRKPIVLEPPNPHEIHKLLLQQSSTITAPGTDDCTLEAYEAEQRQFQTRCNLGSFL